VNCVKKNNIKKGLFTALLLASPFVTAGTQYPASDFQPKVVYQNADYQHEGSSASSASASFGEKSKPDANYPAANFQPEVLYSDDSYKHTKGDITKKSITLAVWEEEVAEEKATKEVAESEDDVSPLFAIIVLAIAGFLFLKKNKSGAKAFKKSKATQVNPEGLTGVARYLQNKAPKLSGVAKYLETHQPSPKSGVAKYVAKKIVANKKAAANNVTGVEKYMRNQKRG